MFPLLENPSCQPPRISKFGGNHLSRVSSIINQNTVATTTVEMHLVATKVGTETLGPASLFYQDAQGKKREVDSNKVTVTVVEKTGFSLFGKRKNPQAQTQTASGS